MLSQSEKNSWEQDGFLVLRNFISASQIDQLQEAYDKVWQEKSSTITVDDLETNRRTKPCLLSEEETKHRFKVNDLYLEHESVRDIVMSHKLAPVLKDLLGDFPVLCNTLSLQYGTQQAPHADSLFMTPVSDHNLVATWIAMEDGDEETGPLAYYSGSHKIPIYRFSTGSSHVVPDEFPHWEKHVHDHLEQMGLKPQRFMPKKGDLFVWSAQLIHGGSPIKDPNKTRKSIVSHYYSLSDATTLEHAIHHANGGFWLGRPPQPIAPAEQALLAAHLDSDKAPRTERVRHGIVAQLEGARAEMSNQGKQISRLSRSLVKKSVRRLTRKVKSLFEPRAHP